MAIRVSQPALTAVSIGTAVPLNWQANYPAIQVLVTAGVGTYNVEYTLDNVLDPTVTPVWQPVSTMSAKAATADATIAFPCIAIRLNVTAYTSGNFIMKVLQGDSIG